MRVCHLILFRKFLDARINEANNFRRIVPTSSVCLTKFPSYISYMLLIVLDRVYLGFLVPILISSSPFKVLYEDLSDVAQINERIRTSKLEAPSPIAARIIHLQ